MLESMRDDDQRRRRRRRTSSLESDRPRRRRDETRRKDYSEHRERAERESDGSRERSRRYRQSTREDDEPREQDDRRRQRRHRDRSRSRDRSRRRRRSRSPRGKRRTRSESASKSPEAPSRRNRAPLPSQNESFRGGGNDVADPDGAPLPEKQKPNFKPTGLLAKEANTVAGTTTVLKYHEPPEARKPPAKEQWRMYVFKHKDLLDTLHLHLRSVWLVGRDTHVTDLLLEHPSISKQHAVIQFRYITTTNEFGDRLGKVKPYLIDLESANGTSLNGKKIEGGRFVELVDGDVVKFGDSEREYVMMLPPTNM